MRDSLSAAIGIDFGGTKIAGALVDASGEIRYQCRRPTEAAQGQERVFSNLQDVISECLAADLDIAGIGIGAPGQLDSKRGLIRTSPNLPGWLDVPLIDRLHDKFPLPFKLDNDVRVAARGEMRYGNARLLHNFAFITLGTGIGACLVIDGAIYSGIDECAGEVGHITLDPDGPLCGCGNRGCLEALAAGPAVARRAGEILATTRHTILREMVREQELTAAMVASAAAAGDEVALEIFAETGRWLGIGLTALVNLFNPEAIIIGGSMAESEPFLFPYIRAEIESRSLKISGNRVQLLRSSLGLDAGMIGAASMLF